MEKIEYPINFEHQGNSILFKNNVKISKQQFDALNRVRGQYTCSTTSYIWQAMLDMTEEDNSVSVNYEKFSFKRIRNEMEFLASSGFFKLDTEEVVIKNRKKLNIILTDIHPALRSIIHLM